MRSKVLTLLKNQYPEYISGEEISHALGVSRTAVWKHIKKLKEDGYEIDSHSRIGYRLVQAPDRLYEHELAGLLKVDIIGTKIVHRDTVDSTNELAKELARKGLPEGTVVVAEEQTGGKGRMGRAWYSPAGEGLWFSVILRPCISPSDAPKLTLVAAVAVARAIREMTGLSAGIKWPNDIMIDGRKVAGILTEMSAEIERVNYLVVGIGINVNLSGGGMPQAISETATSLAAEKGSPIMRAELLAAVINHFDICYRDFINGDFASALQAWKEMSATLNRWVRVVALNYQEEGIAVDVDDEGALLLMKKDGSMKRVMSGDVSIRTAD